MTGKPRLVFAAIPACLCLSLIGATASYLKGSLLLFGLYCAFSAIGFLWIRSGGGTGVAAVARTAVIFQLAGLTVFSVMAAVHRFGASQSRAAAASRPVLPVRLSEAWYHNLFFLALCVVLCLGGLELLMPGVPQRRPLRRFPWFAALAAAIQGAMMMGWSLLTVDAVLSGATRAGAPIGSLAAIVGVWLFGSSRAGLLAAATLTLTGILSLVAATLVGLDSAGRACRQAPSRS